MRLILLGPPGVGKGTQAQRLQDHYAIVHLSTGELLRDEIADGTDLGLHAKSFIDQGLLVPDQILLDMMNGRLQHTDCEAGFLLDGFPRTIPQAEGLTGILATLDQALNAVVCLTADREELIHRLLLRGKTSGRTDDNLAVIRQRLDVYRQQTEPLIDYYRANGLLVEVSGLGTIPEITERIINALDIQCLE
ncbi:MAG: adenylate kinase [FCB group bacterium]|nr:adenylate kinase [FCB group bacterium]